jgi:hypothetical protein
MTVKIITFKNNQISNFKIASLLKAILSRKLIRGIRKLDKIKKLCENTKKAVER